MQLTSLFLTHDSGRQEEVDRLVENFQRQAAALGVTLKVAPFSDI